jgi:hypothetical protein
VCRMSSSLSICPHVIQTPEKELVLSPPITLDLSGWWGGKPLRYTCTHCHCRCEANQDHTGSARGKQRPGQATKQKTAVARPDRAGYTGRASPLSGDTGLSGWWGWG